MGQTDPGLKKAIGYRIIRGQSEDTVLPACPDPACPFTDHTVIGNNRRELKRGIPVYEIDDDVYLGRPDFVVGTIDKVARIGWRPKSCRLFGLIEEQVNGPRDVPPPSLFIQDELHLISGPLGSIDGAFEVMLEHLCEVHGGRAPVVVAATATTKNFRDQVNGLYARSSRVIPPPGISIEDSFFAVRDDDSDGKIYVAVRASGLSGASKMQTLTLSVLAHQAAALEQINADPDPYWSNVVFFSSRRALGMLTSAIESTYRSAINLMHALSGIATGPVDGNGKRKNTRRSGRIRELTATSSEDVGQVLIDLDKPYHSGQAIDLCFATSMVEVGLDVPRLGLMSVMGQPKSANQYIQVTGRVGRGSKSAGLIVTVLNPRVARDRAHHEDFTHWHERLYASVESTSLTPFTARALERSLASVMFAMCRILGSGSDPQTRILSYWDTALAALLKRASGFGPDAVGALTVTASGLESAVSAPEVAQMAWTSEESGKATPFAYVMGMAPVSAAPQTPYWELLNSMRNVDQDAYVRPFDASAPPATPNGGPSGPVAGSPGEEVEEL